MKISKLTVCGLITLGIFAVSGCSNPGNGPQTPKALPATSEASETFRERMNMQTEYSETLGNTLNSYNDLYSFLPSNADDLTLDELGPYMTDERLSSMTRTLPGTSETVTLQEELDRMVAAYLTKLEEMRPDTSLAATLPYVDECEEGILIGGDMLIPANSIEGAVHIEFLNAVAAGADPEELIADLEKETVSYLNALYGAATAGERA